MHTRICDELNIEFSDLQALWIASRGGQPHYVAIQRPRAGLSPWVPSGVGAAAGQRQPAA